MKAAQLATRGIQRLGLWLIEEPNRLAMVVMALSALATAIALVGSAQAGLMVAPGVGGGGGGPS